MKILTAKQTRAADQHTIENEPIKSLDLMERASLAFVNKFSQLYPHRCKVVVVCGTGNNGGDGLAISRLLLDKGYQVSVVVVGEISKGTPDFTTNLDRLKRKGVEVKQALPDEWEGDVVIDGLFGSGLSRPVSGHYAEIIDQINKSGSEIVSIDSPSGLFCDAHQEEGTIVRATQVITFQAPKLAFFLPQNGAYCGNWYTEDIGLDAQYIQSVESNFSTVEGNDIARILKNRPRYFHKGQAGRALLVSGSRGKVGAAVLCARACLRSGVGLLELHIPGDGNHIIQTAVPEAMVRLDADPEKITERILLEAMDAVGIGPGIGQHGDTVGVLQHLLGESTQAVVIDADALNILSEHRHLIESVPANSILTPHPGEFKRLVGEWANDYDRLEKQIDFAVKYKLIIVLKNAHTSIALPDGKVFFNTTGNPGMATAGSGDVLTGIITGFLAQGYSPAESSLTGVYLHGLAGDLAIKKETHESLIASDIVEHLGAAINHVKSQYKPLIIK